MRKRNAKINRKAYEALLPKIESARAQKVLRRILDNGGISTYEIGLLGYGHPPRAAQDLKEVGVLLETTYTDRHPITNNRMGTYVLAAPEPITDHNFKGRGQLPKNLSDRLYSHYGTKCNLDEYSHSKRSLQADHRVPYIVGGDPESFDVNDWQILCGAHQRLKSFECEACPNARIKDVAVCKSCFWASPEEYAHVAMQPFRRVDIIWGKDDEGVYATLLASAAKERLTASEMVKRIVAERLTGGWEAP